jgi:hypothetical protein
LASQPFEPKVATRLEMTVKLGAFSIPSQSHVVLPPNCNKLIT